MPFKLFDSYMNFYFLSTSLISMKSVFLTLSRHDFHDSHEIDFNLNASELLIFYC